MDEAPEMKPPSKEARLATVSVEAAERLSETWRGAETVDEAVLARKYDPVPETVKAVVEAKVKVEAMEVEVAVK